MIIKGDSGFKYPSERNRVLSAMDALKDKENLKKILEAWNKVLKWSLQTGGAYYDLNNDEYIIGLPEITVLATKVPVAPMRNHIDTAVTNKWIYDLHLQALRGEIPLLQFVEYNIF